MDPSWYLNRLRELLRHDFDVTYICEGHGGDDVAFSGIITAKGNSGEFQLHFEEWAGDLTDEGTGKMIQHTQLNPARPFLLFTDRIPQFAAPTLIEHGVNFLDRDGNYHLLLGPDFKKTDLGTRPRSQPFRPFLGVGRDQA